VAVGAQGARHRVARLRAAAQLLDGALVDVAADGDRDLAHRSIVPGTRGPARRAVVSPEAARSAAPPGFDSAGLEPTRVRAPAGSPGAGGGPAAGRAGPYLGPSHVPQRHLCLTSDAALGAAASRWTRPAGVPTYARGVI